MNNNYEEKYYVLAVKAENKNNYSSAFKYYLKSAKNNNPYSYGLLAQYYDGLQWKKMKRNLNAANYWYKKSYNALKSSVDAYNLSCNYRDGNKLDMALKWFNYAVQQGDDEAYIEIAKIYIKKNNLLKSRGYLYKLLKRNNVDNDVIKKQIICIK